MMRSLGYFEWLELSFWKDILKISENRYQIGIAAGKA